MIFKLDYHFMDHHIASFAKKRETLEIMLAAGFKSVFLQDQFLSFFPEGWKIELDEKTMSAFNEQAEYSIFEFSQGCAYLAFDLSSNDPALFITNRCNSNCIMCPVSSSVRKHDSIINAENLLKICKQIPDDTYHVTITGGEPFFLKQDIFKVFTYLKEKLNTVEYLLLTNGRAFADLNYVDMFVKCAPSKILVGIPVHGFDPLTHDRVTRTPGSFEQTISGIHSLIERGVDIEIRIVISKINLDILEEIAIFIADNMKGIKCVKFIGLEMLGNAWKNRDEVWIDYKESSKIMEKAITTLVMRGVDVGVYNYPLCCVDKQFWPLCAKSITNYKVTYLTECEVCSQRDACGGMFHGTYRLMEGKIAAIN